MRHFSSAILAAVGHGDDTLAAHGLPPIGLPATGGPPRAARDHPRRHLYEGWYGIAPAWASPDSRGLTWNHAKQLAGGDLWVDYQRVREWCVAALRRDIEVGLQRGEPRTDTYDKHHKSFLAACVRAAMENGDDEFYSLAVYVWSLTLRLEDWHAIHSGPLAGQARGAGLRCGGVDGFDRPNDVCRHLIFHEPMSVEEQREWGSYHRFLAEPPQTGDKAWLQRAVNAARWMEVALVADVADAGVRIPLAAGLPRLETGTLRVERREHGHRSGWDGPVEIGWGAQPVYNLDVDHRTGEVRSVSWQDVIQPELRNSPNPAIQERRKKASRDPGHFRDHAEAPFRLPRRDLGPLLSEAVLGPGTPLPPMPRLKAPAWPGNGRSDPPEPPILKPNRPAPDGALWDELVSEVNIFRDKSQVRAVLRIVERLREGER